MALNVIDDSHIQTDKGSGIWSGDSAQFCLDPGRSIAPGYYHTNDEIGFALNSQDNIVYCPAAGIDHEGRAGCHKYKGTRMD
ncbi:MAG TPA: hypothetical protein DDW86_00735 [Clostridiales bacterium]|jgi:hypothetical protein|nr:hypothetical protein [Clostridiales bacterium]